MADPIERAARVVRSVEGDVSPQAHRASRSAFLRAIEEPRPRRLGWVVGLASVAAVSVAVFAIFGMPLTYAVEGAPAAHDGAWVRAGDAPAVLRFSDGTVLELKAGGQAEVVSTDARGAVVRVSSGVLHAQVKHRRASRWDVQAGPYTVHVTGTRFSAGRSGDDQIDVELFEGSVEVSGPGLAAPLQLKAGQRFHATLEKTGARVEVSSLSNPRREKSTQVTSLLATPLTAPVVRAPVAAARPPVPSSAPSASPVDPPAAPLAPSAAPPAPSATPPAPFAAPPALSAAPPTAPERVSWRVQVAAGAFAEVLAAARAEGIDQALLRDVDEVFALAEAARYLKEDALAKRSFLAVRRRWPKSADAAQSALLLGRLAEQQTQWAEADQWYQRCELDGVHALIPEALGRRVVVLGHLGHLEQARVVAQRYLELDPSGPWAAVARRTLK